MLITGGVSAAGKLEDLWQYCAWSAWAITMPKSHWGFSRCGLRVGLGMFRVYNYLHGLVWGFLGLVYLGRAQFGVLLGFTVSLEP
jgi:hypothetical protein